MSIINSEHKTVLSGIKHYYTHRGGDDAQHIMCAKNKCDYVPYTIIVYCFIWILDMKATYPVLYDHYIHQHHYEL